MIKYNPKDSYYTDEHKKNLANAAKLKATAKDLYAQRDAIFAAIAKGENPDPNPEARLVALAEGRSAPPPTTLSARRLEILYAIKDSDSAQDYLAEKLNSAEKAAEKKMVEEAKPQIVAAEKAVYDAVQTLFAAFLPYWAAERHLLGNGISPLGLFNSPLGELLGAPMAPHSDWAELFRHGVAQGHISKMPKELV